MTPHARSSERIPVVLDTDLGFGSDDATALLVLTQSERVDLLGVTVVTGNEWLDQEVAHALRLLEIAGRPDVPVYPGARSPLVNTRQEMERREQLYGATSAGGYKGAWRSGGPGLDEVVPSDGRRARKKAEPIHAAEFLVQSLRARPHEIVVAAIGPLTNVAIALAKAPEIAELSRELIVMGGGIETLPEFNFWMDPEAAHQVLRAPWPRITLSPLDIGQRAPFTREIVEAVAEGDSSIARYFQETFVERSSGHPVTSFMYDPVAVLSFLEPQVVTRSETLWLDVEIDHGSSYGAMLLWDEDGTPPPGVRKVVVQLDLDYPRFIEAFLALMKKPLPPMPARKG